jgi:hypothetical protein
MLSDKSQCLLSGGAARNLGRRRHCFRRLGHRLEFKSAAVCHQGEEKVSPHHAFASRTMSFTSRIGLG